MSMFDSSLAQVAVVADVPLPVNVNSGPGITVNKTNSIWQISLDTMSLAEEVVPVPGNLYGAFYDTALGMYERVRMDNFIAAATGLDTRTPIVDANYNVTVHDRYVALTMALTAPRIVTLPPAASVPGGREVMLEDEVGGLSSVNYFSVQPTGTDTVNGAAVYIMGTPYGGARFRSDGTGRWSVVNTSNFYLVPAGQTAYTASADGNVIAWPAFTAPVVTTLPAASAYQRGRRITVADRNGSCTPTNTMQVKPAGSDLINGVAAPAIATMTAAYSTITLFSDGVSAWTVVGGGNITAGTTIVSTQISDSSALGRQLLTNAAAPADRTALGSGAVGDAVFVSATAGAAQTAMGLGSMATQAANGVSITGGAISGVAISGGTDVNTTITTPTISGGTANNMVIGATVPAAASVTSMNGGPLAGQRNMIINGDFRVDQRNNYSAISIPAAAQTFSADRWSFLASVSTTLGVATGRDATQLFAPYTLNIATNTPHTAAAAEYFQLNYKIEGLNMAHLRWGTSNAKPITISGLLLVNPITGNIAVSVRTNSGSRSYVALVNIPTANVWTPFAVTIPGDTAGTWPIDNSAGILLAFDLGSGSNNYAASTNTWLSTNSWSAAGQMNFVGTASAGLLVANVQCEPGPVATPFERRLMGTEMLNCQRYYFQRNYAANVGYGGIKAPGAFFSDYFVLPVTMRATPTGAFGSTANWQYSNAGGVWTATASGSAIGNDPNTAVVGFGNVDVDSVPRLYRNTAATFVSFSAEL